MGVYALLYAGRNVARDCAKTAMKETEEKLIRDRARRAALRRDRDHRIEARRSISSAR